MRVTGKNSVILVTGARGQTGSVLVNELITVGERPIAGQSTQDATPDGKSHCEHRECNFARLDSVASALQNVDAVFLLVPFAEDMVSWGEQFILECQRQRVRFIVRLSGLAAAIDSPSRMAQLHGQIDLAVTNSGIANCILRCNSFMQNFSGHYRYMIKHKGILRLPEGGARSCFVDVCDIAAAAAIILCDPDRHSGHTYDLNGPEALTNTQAVSIIANTTGRALRYEPISEEDASADYTRLGVPAWKLEVLQSLSRFIRAGHAANSTNDLEQILGREPTSFAEFVSQHRACWI